MNKLKIEWKHLDVNGDTCERCSDTGKNLLNEVQRLKYLFERKDVCVEVKETLLSETQIEQSNQLILNGKLIEEIIDIAISENTCESCSDLVGKPVACREVKYKDEVFEDIPAQAIRQAIFSVLGMENEEKSNVNAPNCCSDFKNKCC